MPIHLHKVFPFPKPYWATTDKETVRLYQGDVRAKLQELPPRSVQCVITSPPYWGLRDYGTGDWVGGDPKCNHEGKRIDKRTPDVATKANIGVDSNFVRKLEMAAGNNSPQGRTCIKCGAKRIDQQIGSEPIPDCGTLGQAQCGQCHICTMVGVFREVKRVLRGDGTVWLNYGDTYGGTTHKSGDDWDGTDGMYGRKIKQFTSKGKHDIEMPKSGLPSGNLVGIPWRVALALQEDGWILRQDIIWHKVNPMPESVTNRCTKSHEYIFLFAKGMDYYYDQEAVRIPHTDFDRGKVAKKESSNPHTGRLNDARKEQAAFTVAVREYNPNGANRRSVWSIEDESAFLDWLQVNYPQVIEDFLKQQGNKLDTWRIPSQAFPGAHFATFPEKLVEPCLLAGTSAGGCCAGCGKPYQRIVKKSGGKSTTDTYARDRSKRANRNGVNSTLDGEQYQRTDLGFKPSCYCDAGVQPCMVMDPFAGAGTVALVALKHGRRSVGIELNQKYLDDIAIQRLRQYILSVEAIKHLVETSPPFTL